MPELPEVEVAARSLRRWLRGKTIVRATIFETRITRGCSPKELARALEGHAVKRVDRRGKWLRLSMDDGALVFSHLGMSGKWVKRGLDAASERSERARLDLERISVRYVDPRMFGRLILAREDLAEWRALGMDPLVDGLDVGELERRLGRVRRTIKEALLDQTIVAGVGNIYATEALFLARIDPRSRTDALSRADVRALARGIDRAIATSLAHDPGPEITYVEEAGAPNPFKIYGHGGEPCPRCKNRLVRMVLGGRGTVYCARCQQKRG